MRWENYVLKKGADFTSFWSDHLATKRDVLFIIGMGFDPRMCAGLEKILRVGGAGKRDVALLCYNNGHTISDGEKQKIADNETRLGQSIAPANIRRIDIEMRSSKGANVASKNTVSGLDTLGDLTPYQDVVMDISAVPRVIALTAIAKLLSIFDDAKKQGKAEVPNFHVIVAESHSLDRRIVQENFDEEVVPLKGFSGQLSAEATRNVPRIWLPILGEDRGIRLQRIHEYVKPDEICPVVPSPALNPRRGDILVEQYRERLFDSFQAEPRDILYACEYNPFEAYRQLFRAISGYRAALESIGGCKAFVSPLSSKLLSVAALLACYELRDNKVKIGIPLLEAQSYTLTDSAHDIPDLEMYQMWLAGECYDV